jgi:hypothetical protein
VAVLREWIPEHELKRDPPRIVDPLTRHATPVVPDGAFTLELADGRVQSFYLEQDMGTIAPRRMRAKLRLYLTQGVLDARMPFVLIVAPTLARKAAIARWAFEEAAWLQREQAVAADATRLFLTTVADLTERTVLTAPIWQVVGGPSALALVPARPHVSEVTLPARVLPTISP